MCRRAQNFMFLPSLHRVPRVSHTADLSPPLLANPPSTPTVHYIFDLWLCSLAFWFYISLWKRDNTSHTKRQTIIKHNCVCYRDIESKPKCTHVSLKMFWKESIQFLSFPAVGSDPELPGPLSSFSLKLSLTRFRSALRIQWNQNSCDLAIRCPRHYNIHRRKQERTTIDSLNLYNILLIKNVVDEINIANEI